MVVFRPDQKLAAIAAGMAVLIVYVSLYPFHFHSRVYAGGALRALLATWRDRPTRANFISNVLLYIPFGFFSVRSLRGLRGVGLVALMGLALCSSIEVAQFYDRGRDPGMFDIYTNAGGTLLGAIAGVGPVRKPFLVALALCWLGGLIFPYILGTARGLSLLDLFVQISTLLVIAVLVEAWIRTSYVPVAVVAILFAGIVVIQALQPFQFLSAPRPFGLIPFRSFIEGPRETGIPVFFQKTFSYGALIWLAARAGCPFGIAAAASGTLVLGLRIAQVYLPGRSAEITDAVMVVLLAATMKLMDEVPERATPGRP